MLKATSLATTVFMILFFIFYFGTLARSNIYTLCLYGILRLRDLAVACCFSGTIKKSTIIINTTIIVVIVTTNTTIMWFVINGVLLKIRAIAASPKAVARFGAAHFIKEFLIALFTSIITIVAKQLFITKILVGCLW